MDWLSREEALRMFALGDDVEALEDIVMEFDLDVQVDDDGELVAVQANDLREPLFALHERKTGFRPDDPSATKLARAEIEREDRREREQHRARRSRLEKRVMKRKAARGQG